MDLESSSASKMKEEPSSAVSCLNKLALLAGSTWNKENFDCHLCEYCTDSRAEFELHLSSHMDENSFQYNQPEYEGSKEDRLYQCDECDYITGWRGNLNKHKLKHSGEKPFICCECDYRTANKSNLERHKQKHEKGLMNDEDEADGSSAITHQNDSSNFMDSYKASQILKETVDTHRAIDTCMSQNSLKVDIPKEVKMFQCSYCEYRTKWSSNLSKHKRIHTRDKPYACDECSYRTETNDILKQHKLIHIKHQPYFIDGRSNHFLNSFGYPPSFMVNREMLPESDLVTFPDERSILMDSPLDIYKSVGGKIFQCDECEYRTLWKNNMEKHKEIHLEERPFICDICGFDATTQSNLNRHKLSHMKEMSFQCDLCEYNTMSNRNFKIHELAHMGKQPFPCDQCDYVAISDSSLHEHHLKHIQIESQLEMDWASKNMQESHVIKKEQELSFQCGHCDYMAMTQKDLTKHLLSHHRQKTFFPDQSDCDMASKNHLRSNKQNSERPFHSDQIKERHSDNMLPENIDFKRKENDGAIVHFQYNISESNKPSKDVVKYHVSKTEDKYSNSPVKESESNFLFSHWRPKKSFQCNECEYSTPWKSNLNKHKKKHIREKMFLGNNIYSSGEINGTIPENLSQKTENNHTETNEDKSQPGEKETKENEISKIKMDTVSLDMLKQVDTPAKSFPCDECDYRTPWKSNLNKHKRKHSREKMLNYESNENNILQNNLLKEYGPLYSNLPFQEKAKYFNSDKKDEQSLVPVNNAQNFLPRDFWKYPPIDNAFLSHYMPTSSFAPVCQCDECGYVTRWKSNLYKHKRNVHGRDNFPNNITPDKINFLEQQKLLQICGEKISHHSDDKKFDQSIMQITQPQSVLPLHQQQSIISLQEEQKSLQNDKTSLSSVDVFKAGFSRNSSKELVECDECGYRTPWKSNLYKHKRNVHGREKLYDDKDSPSLFKSTTVESSEQKDITNEIPFMKDISKKNLSKSSVKCEDCGYQTSWKSNLYKHRRNVHSKEKLLNGFHSNLSPENNFEQFTEVQNASNNNENKTEEKQIELQNILGQTPPQNLQYKFVKELCSSTNKYVKYFLCDECEYRTPWKSNLNKHRRKHIREKLYESNYNRLIKNNGTLPESKETNEYCEDETEIKESQLETSAQNYTEMALQKRHRLTNIIDKLCQPDKSENDLQSLDSSDFQCDLCDLKSETASDFKHHRMTHIRRQLLHCDHCNYSTIYLSNLIKHKQKHATKYFFCDKCSFKASTVDRLNRHRRLHIRGILYRRYLKIKRYAKKLNLPVISSLLNSQKKLCCNYCWYRTTLPLSLTLHRLVHARKVFHCVKCNFGTKQKILYKLHVHRHARKPLYNCPHCHFTSWWATHYSHHLLSKHPDKGGVYACEVCSYSTTVVDRFQKHLQYHNGYLPFSKSTEVDEHNQSVLPQSLSGSFVMFCSTEITIP